jgi:hypothetical protein
MAQIISRQGAKAPSVRIQILIGEKFHNVGQKNILPAFLRAFA